MPPQGPPNHIYCSALCHERAFLLRYYSCGNSNGCGLSGRIKGDGKQAALRPFFEALGQYHSFNTRDKHRMNAAGK